MHFRNLKNAPYLLLTYVLVFILHSCQVEMLDLPYDVNFYDQYPTGLVEGTDEDDEMMGSNIHAGYGNDIVFGTDGNDILDGGHGEDKVDGGDGDDLLISRSDGREPRLGMQYNIYRDPDQLINPATLTLNPGQPIKGDDTLRGGTGADKFRFIITINSKEKFLRKFVKKDGEIKWLRITQLNVNHHDHWIERIGNDLIEDFSKADGDQIEIVGHTININHVEYQDLDGDGSNDQTVIFLMSDQKAMGAHHKDHIGTITVRGDLVEKSDILINSIPAIGIVKNIEDLEEAIGPRKGEPDLRSDPQPSAPSVMVFCPPDGEHTCGH